MTEDCLKNWQHLHDTILTPEQALERDKEYEEKNNRNKEALKNIDVNAYGVIKPQLIKTHDGVEIEISVSDVFTKIRINRCEHFFYKKLEKLGEYDGWGMSLGDFPIPIELDDMDADDIRNMLDHQLPSDTIQ